MNTMNNIDNLEEIEHFKKVDFDIKSTVSQAIVKSEYNNNVKVIAVSKTKPAEMLLNAYKSGIKVFGENYVQELVDKHQYCENLSINDIEWHFIGHLQSNKVKYIIDFVDFIHSVDSIKLADEINKRAEKLNKVQKVFLQVNTSGEDSKSGCEPHEVVLLADEYLKMRNIQLVGLMTIGTFTDDENQQRKEFSLLRNLLNDINNKLNLELKELSMGMTNDYPTAINEGATMVRIGTAYFGERNYNK